MMAAAIRINDMSACVPQAAVATAPKEGCWQLIPYETCDGESGTMVGAASFVDAADITLPLNVAGWHAIYVGFWNPHYPYDGGTTVKLKLSDDPCFIRINEPEPAHEYHGTHLKEAFFKAADLTGRDLVLGKVKGPFGQKAYIAFVRLVPLTEEEVAAIKADRERTDTRVLEASIDGISYFWKSEYRSKEHILELVEPYRFSDVGKVYWAVNYGDVTNYPSRVGIFCAGEPEVRIRTMPGANSYIAGEKVAHESLAELVSKGIVPQAVAAEHVHAMGLRFDAMFRLAILGPIPPMRGLKDARTFVQTHPECRQVMKDGTPVQKASYAFPEVRDLMLSIIREAMETFDFDGANLCFVRGPQFMSYETPLLDDFRREYGDDGRSVPLNDPRMYKVRCRYLTDFVRNARRVLDEIGSANGKRLELSAWVYGQTRANRHNGFDVETWVRQGLLDSVIGFVGRNSGHFDAELIAMANAHGCKCIPGLIPWRYKDPVGDAVEFLYPEGADGIALWDLDTNPPDWWAAASRMGHREEIEAFAKKKPELTTTQLKTVGGCDVLQGLSAAVYSGG